MDLIYLNGVKLECIIGVWAWEKAIKQTLWLDIELGTDASRPAKTDQLDLALDYQKVAERLQAVAAEKPRQLLETLAEELASTVLDEFDTDYVKLRLDKGPAVKNVKQVGIVIERRRT